MTASLREAEWRRCLDRIDMALPVRPRSAGLVEGSSGALPPGWHDADVAGGTRTGAATPQDLCPGGSWDLRRDLNAAGQTVQRIGAGPTGAPAGSFRAVGASDSPVAAMSPMSIPNVELAPTAVTRGYRRRSMAPARGAV